MASGEKVGGVYYEVDADTAPLLSATKKVDEAMGGMQDSFKKTDDAMKETMKQMGWYVDKQGKMRDASGRFVSANKQVEAGLVGTGVKMKETAKAAQEVATNTEKASGNLSKLTAAVGAYLSLQLLQSLASLADAYTQNASRIKNATSSAAEYELVQARLLETANGTYRALGEAQEVYLATSDVLKTLGYNTAQVLDITDSLSYSFVRDAARADQATSAMDAYSSALQKGKVDADAWASIMTATPSLVEGIATATGNTTAEIRKIGVEGKLSLEALNEGLLQSLDANKKAADSMATTTADATTLMSNSLLVFVGKVNEASGASNIFVEAVKDMSAILRDPSTVQAATDLAAGIVTAMNAIIQGAAGVVKAVRWMAEEAAAAMGGIAADDVGRMDKALKGAKLELAFLEKKQDSNIISKALAGFTPAGLDKRLAEVRAQIKDHQRKIETAFLNAPPTVKPKVAEVEAPKAGRPKVGLEAPSVPKSGGGGGGGRKAGKSDEDRKLEQQAQAAARYLQSLQDQAHAIKNATAQEKLLLDVTDKKITLQEKQMAEAVKLATIIDQRSNADVIKDLTEQLTNASLSAKELAEKQAVLRLNKWATPEQVEQVKLLTAQISQAAADAAKLAEIGPNVADWVRGGDGKGGGSGRDWEDGEEDVEFNRLSQREFREQQSHEASHVRLIEALNAKALSIEEYHAEFERLEVEHGERMNAIEEERVSLTRRRYGEAFGSIADILKDSLGEQSKAYRAMFAVSKAFAIADATVNAYNAISKAWASAPFPANLAAVASTVPQVMGVVASINSATMGGGRMYGGNVAANSMYRVNEGGAPEIFNAANGQQFLMPNTRGEVVSNSDATSGGGKANVTVNVIESAEKAGNVNQSTDDQGNDVINVWIADFMGDGRTAGAIRNRFALNSQGI